MDAAPKLASSPIASPGDAHGEVAVKALSSSDVVHDAPDVEVVLTNKAPSTNGSSNRGVVKGLVCRLLENSQTPLDDAVSSFDVLPTPVADRLLCWFRLASTRASGCVTVELGCVPSIDLALLVLRPRIQVAASWMVCFHLAFA
ncbi:hypothetical protein Nepgr_013456 [Nepenthes gracilis]|uniref:Uncharacterized protein n=1 Tax=Nepenthes gracilis TaxID=150966 RepID=A0AAD3SHI2_NEPGR|nr:hypothetical protein Nepgr_013456 [Nepenthes gracilis]